MSPVRQIGTKMSAKVSKMHAHAKMTVMCPMDLDAQKLNSTYPCGPFDTYLTQMEQNTPIQNRKLSVRSYGSICTVHIRIKSLQSIKRYVRIMKICTYWVLKAPCSFSSVNRDFCVFFRTHHIWSVPLHHAN